MKKQNKKSITVKPKAKSALHFSPSKNRGWKAFRFTYGSAVKAAPAGFTATV